MRENWSHLEIHRIQVRGYESRLGAHYGWFVFIKGKTSVRCLASDGEGGQTGWEHVSVTVSYRSGKKTVERIPTWNEMCVVKNVFWRQDECVVQYHPPDRNYVNTHKHCLHLWRSTDQGFPVPPEIFV